MAAGERDPLNVKLGVCKVFFEGDDLGFSIGGCEGVYTPEFHETQVDDVSAPIERFLISEKWEAKVPLAESILDVIKKLITHSNNDAPDPSYVSFGSKTGKRSSTKAFELRLHPIANAADDKSDDYVLYKAHVISELPFNFKNDGERILEVTFGGLADTTRADGDMLGMIGDSLA